MWYTILLTRIVSDCPCYALCPSEACYGEQHYLPKHHLAIHLGQQLELHELLISCFVHERRHKILKRFAETVCSQALHLQRLHQYSPKRSLDLHDESCCLWSCLKQCLQVG